MQVLSRGLQIFMPKQNLDGPQVDPCFRASGLVLVRIPSECRVNTEFFLRSRPLRQPAGHRLGRPTGLLAPQSRVGINVGSAMRWDPTGNRRGGQKKHRDDHKGKRVAGADIV